MRNGRDGIRRRTYTCGLALLGVLALGQAAPATAADTELGPYFQAMRTTPVRAAHARVAPPRAFHHAAPPARTDRTSYSPGAFDRATLERTVFNHINLYRLSRGMRPLAEHSELAVVARNHASGVANGSQAFNHSGMRERLMPFMGGFGSRAGGEILAYNRGTADPARIAMVSWINSPTHKDVIESDFTRMGVGVAVAADGRHYFTVLFLR
jgi:uncharacterized protein YkwD